MVGRHIAALRRLGPWLLAALGVVILLAAVVVFRDSAGFGYDYLAYDAAARRLTAGEALYPPGTAEAYNDGRYSGLYLYAPPLAVAVIPLTALSPDAATLAWLFLRILLLALGCAILPVRREVRVGTWFVATISFPVLYDLNLGNVSIVLFALSAAMWRWNGRPAAGVALAAALSMRYTFGLVGIAWVLTRRSPAVLATVAAGIGLVLATLPFVGLAGWLDYLDLVRALDVTRDSTGVALGSFVSELGIGDPWPGAVTLAGIVGSVVAVTLAARRRDADLALVVALAGTLLVAPLMKPPYLVTLLIPGAYVAHRGQWWGLALPLLGWLPGAWLGLAAIAGVVAPFLVAPRGGASQLAAGTSAKRTAAAPSS
jgi:hypothetical protein